MPQVSEEHRAERREQIIDAMLRCAARDGFHKSTMTDVVKESGLSAGAVYVYFKSKDELIRAIVETVASEGFSLVLEGSASDVPAPSELLASVLERILALGRSRGIELHRVALQAWAEAARNPAIRAIYEREASRGRAQWITYTERAVAAGHLPRGTDPERVAHILIGLIPGFMVQRLVFENLTPASYAEGLGELMGRQPAES